MRRVAFVTQKGGAGKSTLAACLAVAAREAGERVFLIDLDPLQSLIGWARERDYDDIPVIAAPASKLERVLDELAAQGITLAIIDSPGGDGAAVDAAIRAATLCLVPARPNAFDLVAGEKTLKKIKERGRDYAFVLNQCPTSRQNARIEEGMATLQSLGVLMNPLIASRVDYQEAARRGLGVSEVNANGAAAQEMRALWACVRKRLGRKPRRMAA
jgi:chromosome partitioning protein